MWPVFGDEPQPERPPGRPAATNRNLNVDLGVEQKVAHPEQA
jgi:hypothetical protein